MDTSKNPTVSLPERETFYSGSVGLEQALDGLSADEMYLRLQIAKESSSKSNEPESFYSESTHIAQDRTDLPVLVRAQALEVGLHLLSHRFSFYNHGSAELQENKRKYPALYKEYEKINEVIPEYFAFKGYFDFSRERDGEFPPYSYAPRKMRQIILEQAALDGLDKDVVAPDPHDFSRDPIGTPESYPLGAAVLAYKLSGNAREDKMGSDNPSLAAWEAALRWNSRDTQQKFIEITGKRVSLAHGLLANLVTTFGRYGPNFEERLDPLEETALGYGGEILQLWKEAAVLPEMFGDQVQSCETRFETLLLALNESRNLYRTRSPLIHTDKDKPPLPVELSQKTVKESLNTLHGVFSYWNAVAASDTVRTVKSVDEGGFSIYRFVDIAGELPPAGWVYIREEAAKEYNDRYEYGRPDSGVDASVSYNVDLNQLPGLGDKIPAIEKGEEDAFSIRVDHEAYDLDEKGSLVRCPMGTRKVTALDIGAILGEDERKSTKISRILAYGAQLAEGRSTTGLNHHRLDAEFTDIVEAARNFVENRRMTPQETAKLQKIGSVGLADVATPKTVS
jgi:hypothetical protein